jgi:hypothetical protein
MTLSFNSSPSREEHSHHFHMTSRASMMEGSPSILMTIDSKHKLIENTNMILSVKNNSLSQQLFHSLEIATATDSEKLSLQRSHHLLSPPMKKTRGRLAVVWNAGVGLNPDPQNKKIDPSYFNCFLKNSPPNKR